MKKILFTVFVFTLWCLSSFAEVKLPSVIGSNMVLQQSSSAALWGTASPGAQVTVSASWGAEASVKADKDGKWETSVATPCAGGPYEIIISDGAAVKLENVLVGEVWFCGGQSNMEMPVCGFPGQPVTGAMDAILGAKPAVPIRIFRTERAYSYDEAADVTGSWELNSPQAVSQTSAVAYFFAARLQETLGVPVGIIQSCVSGSCIEAWLNRKTLTKEFHKDFDLEHLKKTGKSDKKTYRKDPGVLYNGMVAAIAPYTVKGMLWYQGESNVGRHEQYSRLFPAYVRMMREEFKAPDAPFYYVQIATYQKDKEDPLAWTLLREVQKKALNDIPGSAMAVSIDLGEARNYHYRDKNVVADRLAFLALQKTYGFGGFEAVSPEPVSVEFRDGKAFVQFDQAVSWEGQVSGMEIAGADKVFHPAKAKLAYKNKPIVVYSSKVKDPVAVRYCCKNYCVGNMYNNFGIPVAPFRSDDWKE